MIDIHAESHSAIFNAQPRKLSPSLLWAILFAVALHVLLAVYLLTQTFAMPVPDAVPQGPVTTITMDRPIVKPVEHPKQQPVNIIHVHATPPAADTVDKSPLIPVKGPDIAIVTDKPVVLPTGGDVTGTTPTGPMGPAYIDAKWAQFPDAAALSQYYPQRALDDEREGEATVECTVLDTAGHVRCTVVGETPRNYGFGQATASMVEARGRVDTSQGNVKPGSVLRKAVTWKLED